ncbi:MAG TPA: lamin tail domain-containing protein [Pyrinomonadaceae bacterium]|nr:lamin tail domain-containing protein [Pyrinomonadaceae bacterium]
MKRFYLILTGLFILAAAIGAGFRSQAQTREANGVNFVSQNIVISQFFGGGGLSGAPYTHDFVELFNRGDAPVSLDGWSVQYASASGSEWLVTPLSNVTLQPGSVLFDSIRFKRRGRSRAADARFNRSRYHQQRGKHFHTKSFLDYRETRAR